MPKVKFAQGYVRHGNKIENSGITDWNQAQAKIAEDLPGGHDVELGVETIISATTGEVLGRYYTGALGGPYTQVIEPLATAITNAKALLAARS